MRTLGSLTLVWLVIVATPVTAAAQARFSGSGDFQAYCSSCHGTGAKGDGIIAKSLPKRPPDLTQLANRNNGVFPEERVVKMIDGRSDTTTHSGADMPKWGEVFAKSSESPGADATAERIKAMAQYLATIQDKR